MTDMPRQPVFLSGKPPERALAAIRTVSPAVDFVTAQAEPDVLGVCEAALVWTNTDSLVSCWPNLVRLRWVHTVSAGVDNVLFPGLVSSTVVLTNGTGVFDQSVAQYVLALLHAHASGLWETREAQRAHRWSPRQIQTLAGRTLLVVGLGGIGGAVAEVAAATGMIVHAVRRTSTECKAPIRRIYVTAELHEALAGADYVVLALPLTTETRGLIDRSALACMRRTAYLVNVGRGEVLLTNDLLDALRRGQLAGAALDVVEREPLPPDDPLWDAPGVFISPHMAADVPGWEVQAVNVWAANLHRFLGGRPLNNVVDKMLGY